MTLRIVGLIGMLASWIALYPATGSALAGYQVASTSISIGPDQQLAAPGEIVSFSVGVSYFDPQGGIQAAFSGGVLVLIPSGLTLVGQPSCTAGCGFPSVRVVGQESSVEVQVDIRGDERASMSFQVMVSPSAAVGSSYQLTAYLLGGVNTAGGSETAFATLTVTGSTAGSGPVDNREAYLDVTPRLLRVAPGGSAQYFIQPLFWGDWGANYPDYEVEIRVPAGITLQGDPTCVSRQSPAPGVITCELQAEQHSDGTMVISAQPGFTAGDSNGLFVTLVFDPSLPVDSRVQIHTFLRVLSGAQHGAYQGVNAVVVDSAELGASGESGVTSGRLELMSNFSRQGDACIWNSTNGYDFVLFEWGLTTELGRIPVPTGYMGTASDRTGAEVCVIELKFDGVPSRSLYVVAHVSTGETIPCRACVLGLMNPSQQAELVFER